LLLRNTGEHPYELFAQDVPTHPPNNQQPLYGSVPYITSLGTTQSSSVTWVNSAHTWVSISDMDSGKYVNFISESGALEFFVFAAVASNTTNHVKTI
jgi:alpha-glucosidase (family GH31 glycosyl hydrolase)